jgi:hypothetical protein
MGPVCPGLATRRTPPTADGLPYSATRGRPLFQSGLTLGGVFRAFGVGQPSDRRLFCSGQSNG